MFRYYQLAAESGHLDAQNNLGVLFEEGQGVKQDYRKALKWYKSAAEQGNCAAQFNVGRCYQLGYGTFQGLEKAFEYYCLAWRHQCVQAGNNLGVYYTLKWLKNTGNDPLRQAAIRYFISASQRGCRAATDNLGILQASGPQGDLSVFLQPMTNPSRGFQLSTSLNQKVIQLAAYQKNEVILEQDYFFD